VKEISAWRVKRYVRNTPEGRPTYLTQNVLLAEDNSYQAKLWPRFAEVTIGAWWVVSGLKIGQKSVSSWPITQFDINLYGLSKMSSMGWLRSNAYYRQLTWENARRRCHCCRWVQCHEKGWRRVLCAGMRCPYCKAISHQTKLIRYS